MVDVDNNNGDVLSCIIILIDSIALENNAAVVVETHHNKDCTLVGRMEEEGWSKEVINGLDPTSGDALAHLYACNCDAGIEAVFSRSDGETLLVPIALSQMVNDYPWLKDDKITRKMLNIAKKLEPRSPMVEQMKPSFQKHIGYHSMPDISGTIH